MKTNQPIKAEIRQSIRSLRNSLSAAQKENAEKAMATQLINNQVLIGKQQVASFLSFDGEISTQSTNKEIFRIGSKCFLPKLRPFKPNRLWFMPFQTDSKMENNRYGIAEVNLPVNHAISVSALDVILLPLVAFDKTGSRLGMGGGFYDATFQHLRKNKQRPKFIGLAYDLQLVESLPSDPWDLPLDGVCTETSFYSFK